MINMINTVGDNWISYFGFIVIQNTLFLGLIFFVLSILRHANALTKYFITLLGLFKLIIPPFLPGSFMRLFSQPIDVSASSLEISNIMVVASAEPKIRLTVTAVFFILWFSTSLVYLLFALFSTFNLKRKVNDSIFLETISFQQMKLKLYSCQNITVPMSIGILPRKIYVPKTWHQLDKTQKRALLSHEMAHIRLKDGLVHLVQIVGQAVYFFHPLVWLLNERIDEYREMVCDDKAIKESQVTPLAYSRYLVHIAENVLQPSWSYTSVSALIRQKNKLYNRVNYQVKENNMRQLSKKRVVFVYATLFAFIIPLSWYCSKDNSQETLKTPNDATSGIRSDVNPPQLAKENNHTSGKIWGTVVDQKTGEALPGVNVVLEGTNKGAATDREGRFNILNVPPGIYSLQISMMGYRTVQFQDIKVKVDESTKVDASLVAAIIHGESIKVIADSVNNQTYSMQLLKSQPSEIVSQSKPLSLEISKEQQKSHQIPFEFVAYDTPPRPVGGYGSMTKNLKYPEIARKAGVEGKVTVLAHLDVQGNVIETKIDRSLGNNGCDEAAVNAIKMTKWQPALQRNKPVEVWVAIPVVFSLK